MVITMALSAALLGCRSSNTGPAAGDLAPDFVLPRLDGSVQKLSNYRGRVVMVNLWATWCPPCVEELPLLDQIVADYGPRGVVVLGVAADERKEAVERFVDSHKPAFEVLLDPGGVVGTQYGITGYPETFLVDREGRLQVKYIGPLPSADGKPGSEITGTLDSLLGG
jgi:thiol-disulfide isomerase/thioredoxin